jgi:3-methyladenine DNA glycosylase Tag/YHS domain-containing protein
MTPEQRREQMLSETEDVAEDSKIYIYGADAVQQSVSQGALKQMVVNGEKLMVRSLPNQLEIVNGFYSPIEKAVMELPQERGTASQFLAQIKKAKGVKGDELEFTGVEAWLTEKGNDKITRQDILDYMKENRVEIFEVVKGENVSKELWEKLEKSKKDADERKIQISNEIGALGINSVYKKDGEWLYGDKDFKSNKNKVPNKYITELEEINKAQDDYWDAVKKNQNNQPFSQVDPKFSEYQLEGEKESYKEVLVTMPFNKGEISFNVGDEVTANLHNADVKGIIIEIDEDSKTPYTVEVNGEEYYFSQNQIKEKKGNTEYFTSSHFNEPNILVHLRMNTRTDAEGNKVLFLEEIQSDWGQQGKKEGFKSEAAYKKADDAYGKYLDRMKAKYGKDYDEYYTKEESDEEYTLLGNRDAAEQASTPTAPFVTSTPSWVRLGIKVALKEAVAQGATKIAWTTGEQQFERWGSEKIDWVKTENGWNISIQEQVSGTAFDGMNIDEKALSEKGITITSKEDLKAAIDRTLSREKTETERQKLTDRIWDRMQKEDKGTSLPRKEGMQAFYDNVVTKEAKAVVKELAGKEGVVGETDIELKRQKVSDAQGTVMDYEIVEVNRPDANWAVFNPFTGDDVFFETETEAELYVDKLIATKEGVFLSTQQSIEITPEIKAAVGQGMPLFQQANAQYRIESGRNLIEALQDFSGSPKAVTAIMHEIMHPTVVEIFNGAREGNAVALKHANTIISEYNKANPRNQVTLDEMLADNESFKNGKTTKGYRAVQEFIAESWEQYHLQGNQGFSKAFQDVLDMITAAFRAVYGSLSNKELTPELRGFFDELLGNGSNVVYGRVRNENAKPGEDIEYEDGGSIVAYERVGKDGKSYKKVKYNGGRAVSVTDSAYEAAINDILTMRALGERVGFTPKETAEAMQPGFTQGDLFATQLGQNGTVTLSGNVPSVVVDAVDEAIGNEVNENAEGVTDSEADAVTNAERYADNNSPKDVKAKRDALNKALADLKKMVKDNYFDVSKGVGKDKKGASESDNVLFQMASKPLSDQEDIHFDIHAKMMEVAGLYFDLFVAQASEVGMKEFNSFRKFVEGQLGPSLANASRGFMLKQMELAFNTVKNQVVANEEMLPLTKGDVAIAMGLSGTPSNSAIVNGLSGEKAKANIGFQSVLIDIGRNFVDKQFGLVARSRDAIRALGKGRLNWRRTRMRDFFNATAGYRNYGAKVKTLYSNFYASVYSNLGSLKINFGDSKTEGNVSKRERVAQYLNTYIFMRSVIALEDRVKARVDKVDAFKQRVDAAIQSLGIPDVTYDSLKKTMVASSVKDPDSYDGLVNALGYGSIEDMQRDFRRYNNMENMNNEVLKSGVISHGVINVNGSEVQVTYEMAEQFLDNVAIDQSDETARQLDIRANAYFDFQKNLLAYRLEMGEISTELYNELKDNDYMLRSWTAKEIVEAINLDIFNSGLRDKLTVQKAGGADGHRILRGGKPFASLGNDAMMATMLNLNASMRKVARNNMLMSFVSDYVPTIMAHVDKILEDKANALAKSGKSMSYVDRHLERVKSTLFYELNQVGVDEFGRPKFEDIDKAVAADMKLLGMENSFEDYEFYDAAQKRTRKIKVHSDLAKELFAYDEINPTVNKIGTVLSHLLGTSILKPLAVNMHAAFAITQLAVIDPLHQSFVTDAHGWFWPAATLKAMVRATGYSASRVKDGVADKFTGLMSKKGKFNRDIDDWVMHGGNMVTLASSFRTRGTAGFRDSSFSRFMDALQTLPETTELAMRLTTYSALRDKGIAKFKKENGGRAPSGVELRIIKTHAANATNEAMDYGVSGNYTPVFGAVIPFFNATMRAFVSTGKYFRDNPALATFKASQYAGLVIAVAVFNKMNGDDDDKNEIEGYNQFGAEDKKRGVYIWTPFVEVVNGRKKRKFIRIPTGTNTVTGVLNTLGDYVADSVVYAPSSSSRSYSKRVGMKDVISTLYTMSPLPTVDVAPVVSGSLVLFGNYDTFRREKVYKGKKDVSPDLQYDEYTRRIFIDLAKLMDGFGVDSPPSAKQLQEAVNKVFVLNNPIINGITNTYAITSEAVVPKRRVSEVEGAVGDFFRPFNTKYLVTPSSKPVENEAQKKRGIELNNVSAMVEEEISGVRAGKRTSEQVVRDFVGGYKALLDKGFNSRELNSYVRTVTSSFELSSTTSDAFVKSYMSDSGQETGGALLSYLKSPNVSATVKKEVVDFFVVVGKFNPNMSPTNSNYEGSFMQHVFDGSHGGELYDMFVDSYREETGKFEEFKSNNKYRSPSVDYVDGLNLEGDERVKMIEGVLKFWYSLERLSKK